MKLKSIVTRNLEDSKLGKIVIFLVLALILLVSLADQFSLENRCKNKVLGLTLQLPTELKVNKAVLESVQKQEIDKCIRDG